MNEPISKMNPHFPMIGEDLNVIGIEQNLVSHIKLHHLSSNMTPLEFKSPFV